MINLLYDCVIDHHCAVPNLAVWRAQPRSQEWKQFDHHWPRTTPLRLLMYFDHNQVDYTTVSINDSFEFAWYPVGIGWFDFAVDYFELVPCAVRDLLQQRRVKVLFYYHEGDNPQRIYDHLVRLCHQHRLPPQCWIFVSANTAAEQLDQFLYFPDHEYFFRHLNRHQAAASVDCTPSCDFTALNRLHKWWRLAAMSDLWRNQLLENSIWSYNTAQCAIEPEHDNPISIDWIPGLRPCVEEFLKLTPKYHDDPNTHNNHSLVNQNLFHQSRCHIVFETHFDADQSHGTFLTEKTFKAIKYGQPFVMVAPPGSLKELENMGYRVFRNCYNTDYDQTVHNTQRWQQILQALIDIKADTDWWNRCRADCEHNQRTFVDRESPVLNKLIKDLKCLQW